MSGARDDYPIITAWAAAAAEGSALVRECGEVLDEVDELRAEVARLRKRLNPLPLSKAGAC